MSAGPHAASRGLIIVTVAWTAAMLISYAAFVRLVRRSAFALATAQARESFEKDLAYRRWAAMQGGVYVPLSAQTPPNAWLVHPARDVVTTSGVRLTLVNPAYMTRLVLEADRARRGVVSKITALKPLRPGNAPDAWEADALRRIEAGATEVVEEPAADATSLRYMGRLVAERPCVGCHLAQGAVEGRIRGGTAIHVPLALFHAEADAQVRALGAWHAAAWLLGLAGIAVTGLRTRRREREREREREAREALEAQLAHARRLEALGRLAGGVAHDLNNLLSPILGNAELALDRPGLDPALREELADIEDAAKRARALTQQLLAFGRKQVLAVEPLDAAAVVGDLMPMMRSLAGSAIELRADLPRSLAAIRADRAQLGAALLNLAANARDAMAGGGVLTLSVGEAVLDPTRAAAAGVAPGRYVTLAVADTGIGMDAVTRARLFEPFFTTKEAGNGLGLASAHGTVRQLGGAIEVESAPGRGSTFRILLPATGDGPAPAPVPAARPGPLPGGRETLLLVEDEDAVRKTAANLLRSLGYTVLAAGDAEEALRLVAGRELELGALVSDLRMPRVDGIELRARLARLRPGLPTVFITGYAGDSLNDDVPLPPASVVVGKPFTVHDLGGAVRRVLDEARAAGLAAGVEPSRARTARPSA